MTKARTMVRGAFLSGAGMIASMAGSLVSAVIFGRMLPESQVGVFWMLILLCDGLLILSNFGLHSALPKIIADAPEAGRGEMGAGILLVQGAISLALGIVLFAAWLLLPDPRVITANTSWLDLYPHLWILPLLCIAATQRDTSLAILAGMNRYSGRAVGLIVGSAVQVTLVVVAVAWLKLGLVALTLCTFVSYVAAAAWLIGQVGRFRIRGGIWQSYARAVRFSIPLYINNVLGFAFQRADTVLVAMLLGSPTLVAYFEMAKRLPNLISRILTAMLVPYLPGLSNRLSDGDFAGASRLLNQTLSLMAFLGYSSVLAMVVIQRPLIVLLFSQRYLACLPVLWLLMTGACLAIQAGILGLSLVAAGHPGHVTRANIVTAAVSIILNCALIPRFGIIGAAWSLVAVTAMSALLQGYFVNRCGLRLTATSTLVPHAAIAVCLALTQYKEVFWIRASALLLFVVLCLAASVVTPRQLVQWGRHVIPGQRAARV
ncbi:MAG: oligosaccharide flippase family protein [Candidatus Hydrogenedentes bacterium]|nr:oligosaccharide flippase family protein [Candidatus Hydrogenedentota bacterium]